jgi:putative SOS response-associated peptidase YedK
VILTTQDEIDLWLTPPALEALKLLRPLPDGALRIIARGDKQDAASIITSVTDAQPAQPSLPL